jgi:hypothetical protein
MEAIDPVTLVVVQNGLQQVASEMDLTFELAAFSPVISEGFEFLLWLISTDGAQLQLINVGFVRWSYVLAETGGRPRNRSHWSSTNLFPLAGRYSHDLGHEPQVPSAAHIDVG